MRLAVVVAPRASESVDPSTPREGSAWLRDALARLAFDVIAIEGDAALEDRLANTLRSVGADDAVLVHVRGRVSNGALQGDARAVSLHAIGEAIGACASPRVLVIAELTHDREDAVLAAEQVEEIREAFSLRARNHAALVAVRPESSFAEPLAFTELALRASEALVAEGANGARLDAVVERLRSMPEMREAAQSFTFLRGGSDIDLVPPRDEDSDAPSYEALLALSDGARAHEEWEQALAGYKATLVFAPNDPEVRAAIHVRLGGVERARGNIEAATRAFEKARAASPTDRAAIDALISLATEAGDWGRAVELSRARVAQLETPSERVEELFALSRMLVEKMRDLPAAVHELERARAIDPTRDDVLEALRRAYRVLSAWPKLIEVTGALADRAVSSAERAARRFAQAKLALEQMRDEPQAIVHLESSLEEDATHDEALDVLVSVRTARGERAELARTLTRLIERFEELEDDERASDAERRLAAIHVDRADLTSPGEELLEARSAEPSLEALEAAANDAPLDPDAHARLFALHLREGRIDRAYLEALALEELKALSGEAAAIVDRYRPDGLRLRAFLDDDAWRLLRAPGTDDVLTSLFGSISRAAITASLDERRLRRKLVTLDPERRQHEKSTASIVRSFHWAAQVLGVPCPALYVLDHVAGDIAAVPALEPSTALGPGVLRGLTTRDLAFLAGRHLTYYRPESSVLLYFPTLQELTVLVLAAVQLALPAMPIPPAVAPTVEALRVRLARHLRDGERKSMTEAVQRLDERGGKVGLPAWIRSVELTAGRAGLLLAGDLRAAMTRVRSEARAGGTVPLDERRADLVSFCTSRAHAELRADLAVTTTSSLPPPPLSMSGVRARAGYAQSDWASGASQPGESAKSADAL